MKDKISKIVIRKFAIMRLRTVISRLILLFSGVILPVYPTQIEKRILKICKSSINIYRKSSIRSQTCIILDPTFLGVSKG